MTSSKDNPYAPPKAPVRDIAPRSPDSGTLARRSTRLWAALVDIAIGAALVTVFVALFPDIIPEQEESFWAVTWIGALWLLMQYLLFLLLNGWLLATRGQTIGKALFQLRMVRPDGSAASFARLAGLRYGTGYVLMLSVGVGVLFTVVDMLFIFSRTRRCLHAHIAGTVVVRM